MDETNYKRVCIALERWAKTGRVLAALATRSAGGPDHRSRAGDVLGRVEDTKKAIEALTR